MTRIRKQRDFSDEIQQRKMGTESQSRKKAITVTQVGWAALFLAIAGGVYGFFTGGPVNMIIAFVASFIAGFILFYVCASFIVLLRR